MSTATEIERAKTISDNAIAQANSFMATIEELSRIVFDIEMPTMWSYFIFDKLNDAQAALQSRKPARPIYRPISDLVLPELNTVTVDSPKDFAIQEFTGHKPTTNMPVEPVLSSPVMPIAEELEQVLVPVKPNITYPVKPDFTGLDIIIPPVPSFTNWTFDNELPDVSNIVVPTYSAVINNAHYTSDLLTVTESKLLNNINNGGYGIDEYDRQRIWTQAKDREASQQFTVIENFKRTVSQSGFPIPVGAYINGLVLIADEANRKMNSINRDIAIKEAELFNQNYQFTVQQSIAFLNLMINEWNSFFEREVNVQRFYLEAAVQLFTLQINKTNLLLARYETALKAFEARLRGELQKVSIYQTQIDAERLKVDIRDGLIKVFTAEMQAVQLQIEIYKTEMEASQIFANIQKLKLEKFQTQIQAFIAEINANAQLVDLFKSKLEAEKLKWDIYDTEVKAYISTVNAIKAKADIDIAKIEAQIKQAEYELSRFKTVVDSKVTEYNTIIKENELLLETYKSDSAIYNVEVNSIAKLSELGIMTSELNVRSMIEASKISLGKAELELKQLEAQANVRFKAGDAGAQIFTGLVGGSLSMVNTVVAQLDQNITNE